MKQPSLQSGSIDSTTLHQAFTAFPSLSVYIQFILFCLSSFSFFFFVILTFLFHNPAQCFVFILFQSVLFFPSFFSDFCSFFLFMSLSPSIHVFCGLHYSLLSLSAVLFFYQYSEVIHWFNIYSNFIKYMTNLIYQCVNKQKHLANLAVMDLRHND